MKISNKLRKYYNSTRVMLDGFLTIEITDELLILLVKKLNPMVKCIRSGFVLLTNANINDINNIENSTKDLTFTIYDNFRDYYTMPGDEIKYFTKFINGKKNGEEFCLELDTYYHIKSIYNNGKFISYTWHI